MKAKKIGLIALLISSLFWISCQKENIKPPTGVAEEKKLESPMCFEQERPGMREVIKKLLLETAREETGTEGVQSPSTDEPVVLYFDFDGETVTHPHWNEAATFTCVAPALSAEHKQKMMSVVREDFAAYNVIISTDRDLYSSATKKIHIIGTNPNSAITPFSVAGTTYNGSFYGPEEALVFIFDPLAGDAREAGKVSSHEIGHALGLYHPAHYPNGCGAPGVIPLGTGINQDLSWNNTMAQPYYTNIQTWAVGPNVLGCSVIQNDPIMIGRAFGWKPDDVSNSINGATPLQPGAEFKGVLHSYGDVDVFKINSKVNLELKSGGNTDFVIEIYDKEGKWLGSIDDKNSIHCAPRAMGASYKKRFLAVRQSRSFTPIKKTGSFGGYTLKVTPAS